MSEQESTVVWQVLWVRVYGMFSSLTGATTASFVRNSFCWQGGNGDSRRYLVWRSGWIHLYRHNIDTWAFADIVAPAIIMGQAIGRMANLLNGDAFGHPTGGSFGIIYPSTTLAYQVMVISLFGLLKYGKDKLT